MVSFGQVYDDMVWYGIYICAAILCMTTFRLPKNLSSMNKAKMVKMAKTILNTSEEEHFCQMLISNDNSSTL